ncbi:MAG: zf-HC2 domain-containing protein [Candidatus Aminicenantes bacterium]|nr:zf-HC2 domain-containing protein [Candidatus Aminicenantes bacterium]
MNEHIRSEDLAAYVDGLLSVESKSAVENHIAGCSSVICSSATTASGRFPSKKSRQRSRPRMCSGPPLRTRAKLPNGPMALGK